MIHKCVWRAVDGRLLTVAVTAGCTTRTSRVSKLHATPFLHGDPLLRPNRRHHRCRTPGQLRQFGLEVSQSEFPCRRSREISAAAYWGLGKSLRTHPPGVGHPSKPQVLARSENPPSEQRPCQRAQTKLPAGNTGATAKLGAVTTCGPITCAADAGHPIANKFLEPERACRPRRFHLFNLPCDGLAGPPATGTTHPRYVRTPPRCSMIHALAVCMAAATAVGMCVRGRPRRTAPQGGGHDPKPPHRGNQATVLVGACRCRYRRAAYPHVLANNFLWVVVCRRGGQVSRANPRSPAPPPPPIPGKEGTLGTNAPPPPPMPPPPCPLPHVPSLPHLQIAPQP
jgi:hypothetical protein